MKVVVSSDKLTAINFEQAHTLSVDISVEGYPVVIDGAEISHHKDWKDARNQLYEIINVMSADGNVVYQAEDTE